MVMNNQRTCFDHAISIAFQDDWIVSWRNRQPMMLAFLPEKYGSSVWDFKTSSLIQSKLKIINQTLREFQSLAMNPTNDAIWWSSPLSLCKHLISQVANVNSSIEPVTKGNLLSFRYVHPLKKNSVSPFQRCRFQHQPFESWKHHFLHPLLRMSVCQCASSTIAQCPLSVWVYNDRPLLMDTEWPTPWIRVRNV